MQPPLCTRDVMNLISGYCNLLTLETLKKLGTEFCLDESNAGTAEGRE